MIAKIGEVHGIRNHGDDVLTFISVVAPFEAGYTKVAFLHSTIKFITIALLQTSIAMTAGFD